MKNPFAKKSAAERRNSIAAQLQEAEAQADAAKDRKRREPAGFTARILAVRERQSSHQGPDRHSLYEGGDQGASSEAQIPDPAQPLRLVAKLECHAAQDQAQQHDNEREIKC